MLNRPLKTIFLFSFLLGLSQFAFSQDSTRIVYIPVEGGKVFCKIAHSEAKGIPLLLIHGGPGGGSAGYDKIFPEYITDRPVIRYDQLGCGQSDRPEDTTLWTVAHFVKELDQVIHYLGYDSLDILGHSWGGTLVAQYLISVPNNRVRKAVASSPLIDTRLWEGDARKYIKKMSKAQRYALNHWENDTTSTHQKAYKEAEIAYYAAHVYRKKIETVVKKDTLRTAKVPSFNFAVYKYMWGTNEFSPSGTLKNYSCLDSLRYIDKPLLYMCGAHDEAAPKSVKLFHKKTPNSKISIIPNASHSDFVEHPEIYFPALKDFLGN